MSVLLRAVGGGKGHSAKPMSPAESLASLRLEYDKLASEFAEAKSDLDLTKAKLKNKKNDLEKARQRQDDLIEQLSDSNKNNKNKIDKLELKIKDKNRLLEESNSLTTGITAERDSAFKERDDHERNHAATKVVLKDLQGRYGRIRLLCISLVAAMAPFKRR